MPRYIILAAQKITQDILDKYGSESKLENRRAASILAIQSTKVYSGINLKKKLFLILEQLFNRRSEYKSWHQSKSTLIAVFKLWALRERANRENLDDALSGHHFSKEGDHRSMEFSSSRLEVSGNQDNTTPNLGNSKKMGEAGYVFGRNIKYKYLVPESENDVLSDPDPIAVANALLARKEFKPAKTLNVLAAAWIQFQNHEWFRHSLDKEWEKSLGIHKSKRAGVVSYSSKEKSVVVPVFSNEFSHWWDGSQIYGESPESQFALRDNGRSQLKTELETTELDKRQVMLLPEKVLNGRKLGVDVTGNSQNMWVGLSLLQNLFSLEHNRICSALEQHEPSIRGSRNRIYRTARLINSALMIKIHSIEWSVALLNNPATRVALNANWQGLFASLHFKNQSGFPASNHLPKHHGGSDVLRGILGSTVDHYEFPYSLTEEFVAVYRLHALLPDSFHLFDINQSQPEFVEELNFNAVQGSNTRSSLRKYGPENWYYSLGVANAGSVSLNNYPNSLRKFNDPDHGKEIDLAVVDLYRDRERVVPRYNEFRHQIGLPKFKNIDEFVDQIPEDEATRKVLNKAFKELYGDSIDKVDLLVGLHAESKPQGFGISDTAFRIFLHMASRRIKSDVFLTEYLNEETYTATGLSWVANNNFRSVLLRHYPKLEPFLAEHDNPFAPWKN